MARRRSSAVVAVAAADLAVLLARHDQVGGFVGRTGLQFSTEPPWKGMIRRPSAIVAEFQLTFA